MKVPLWFVMLIWIVVLAVFTVLAVIGVLWVLNRPASGQVASRTMTVLRAPSIGLETGVIRMANQSQAPAWMAGQYSRVGPGERGNLVIGAHSVSLNEGATFAHIKHLDKGDVVSVETEGSTYDYIVTTKRYIPAKDLELYREPPALVKLFACATDEQGLPVAGWYVVVTGRLAPVGTVTPAQGAELANITVVNN